jgi:hypothetical protein
MRAAALKGEVDGPRRRRHGSPQPAHRPRKAPPQGHTGAPAEAGPPGRHGLGDDRRHAPKLERVLLRRNKLIDDNVWKRVKSRASQSFRRLPSNFIRHMNRARRGMATSPGRVCLQFSSDFSGRQEFCLI